MWYVKLFLGAVISFLAIFIWSKNRIGAWSCFVASVLISYVKIIFEMMEEFGIINFDNFVIDGIPIINLCLVIIPLILLIISLILFLREQP